jgi:hypothetical protein
MASQSPLQNLAVQARWLVPVTIVAAAIVGGNLYGLGVGLLTFAGGVLCSTIWLIWSSLQGLSSDAPLTLDEALSLGAPSAEEEQKRAVLRALKDLEYERAVGKINDADYESLAQHYRNEAKRLLRAVDADLGPERERAEQILAERLSVAESRAAEGRAAGSAAAARSGGVAKREASGDEDTDDEDHEEPVAPKSSSSDVAP